MANQKHHRYAHVLNLISGIMFLGTPHNQPNQEEFRDRIFLLLKCCSNGGVFSKQQMSDLIEDFWTLKDVANRFQDMNIHVDIMSIYEKRVTKIEKSSFFAKSSKQIVSFFNLILDYRATG